MRSTSPDFFTVNEGLASSSAATTVVMICWSVPWVDGSSTVRIAECRPLVAALAETVRVTGLFSLRSTFLPPTSLNVSSWLLTRASLWLTAFLGPVVRVTVMSYSRFLPTFRPPSRS